MLDAVFIGERIALPFILHAGTKLGVVGGDVPTLRANGEKRNATHAECRHFSRQNVRHQFPMFAIGSDKKVYVTSFAEIAGYGVYYETLRQLGELNMFEIIGCPDERPVCGEQKRTFPRITIVVDDLVSVGLDSVIRVPDFNLNPTVRHLPRLHIPRGVCVDGSYDRGVTEKILFRISFAQSDVRDSVHIIFGNRALVLSTNFVHPFFEWNIFGRHYGVSVSARSHVNSDQ